jgi:molecular chaperone GrpE
MEQSKADDRYELEDSGEPLGERVRVNDRRRINLDKLEGAESNRDRGYDAPNLKPSYVEELEERTRAAEASVADVQGRFQQLRDDLRRETDEVRKRLTRASEEQAIREKAGFLASFLPVVDNLQRAVDAAEGGGSKEALLDGLRSTISGFESILMSSGAEPIDAVGQQFDPELHEAVDTKEVEPELDGQVTAQHSRGYRLGNQLLRPARVQVGRAKSEAQAASE